MRRVTLGQFLQNVTPYERASLDIDPGLRRGALLSWLILGILGVISYFFPDGSQLSSSAFFYWTKDWLAEVWDFVAENRMVLILIYGAMFLFNALFFVSTHGFRKAEILGHIALFVPIVVTAVNVVYLFVLLLPIFANLVVWICLTLVVGGLFLLVIFILLNSRNG